MTFILSGYENYRDDLQHDLFNVKIRQVELVTYSVHMIISPASSVPRLSLSEYVEVCSTADCDMS